MNGERMRRLADALEGAEDFDMEGLAARGDRLDRRNGRLGNMNRFHMGEWASGWRTAAGEEGTVGGVAGWACALFGDERELGGFKRPDGLYEVPEFMCAQELLDLSADEAEELFSPNQAIWTPSRIKAKDAAAAVRKAATGLNQFSWWKHLDDERETTMREYEVSVFRVDGSSLKVLAESKEDAVRIAKGRAAELLENRAKWVVFDPEEARERAVEGTDE